MRRWLVLFIGLMCLGTVQGQDIQFSADAPSEVAVGQEFQITFTLNSARASNFKAPTFKGLNIHWGPAQGSSQSLTIINGVRQQRVELTLTYGVSATSTGMFNFTPATIEVDGQTYKSNGLSIRAVKASQAAASQSGGHRGQPQYSTSSSSAPSRSTSPQTIGEKDLYLRAIPSKTNPYEGEQVLVTYKIYTTVGVRDFSVSKTPHSQGFWTEDLRQDQTRLTINKETLNGKGYTTSELSKLAVYPQNSGKLNIAPLEMDVIAQVATARRSRDPFFDFFDDPFGAFGGVENIRKKIRSNTINLQVKPLPSGAPESFKGNVGQFEMTTKIDQTKVRANEAIKISLTISGHGNLRHIEAPELVLPEDFEVYDPQCTEAIQSSEHGLSGKKTYDYIFIPRSQGTYEIEPIRFSYFDPKTERYREISSEAFILNVGAPTEASQNGLRAVNSNLPSDIAAFKSRYDPSRNIDQFIYSTLFWIIMGAILSAFAILLVAYRRYLSLRADIIGMRNKGALKAARKCLQQAKRYSEQGQSDLFYQEISKALWGYVNQKFNIAKSDLSIEYTRDVLSQSAISAQGIETFVSALEECEFQRFSPQRNSETSMYTIYLKAFDCIVDLANELETLKKKKSV